MMKQLRKLYIQYQQFLRYGLIGISGATLDFILFAPLYNSLGMPAVLANVISTSCGITNNFFLNSRFNFKKNDHLLLRFLSFFATGLLGLVVSSAILRVFHDYAGFNANIVKLASIVIVVILQYSVNKAVSFREYNFEHASSLRIMYHFVVRHWLSITVIAATLALLVAYLPVDLLGVDEADNFLSAKLILHGQLPYVDFFSHHMPGTYFISTIFYVLANGDPLLFRICFVSLLFGWLLLNYRLLYKYCSPIAAYSYALLTALAHGLLLQHMVLAESFILMAISTVLIALCLMPVSTLRQKRWLIGIPLLLFLVNFVALAYIYVTIILYIAWLLRILPLRPKVWVSTLTGAGVPYMVFGGYLIASRSLKPFIFQNLTFNAKYYGPYFGDLGSNPVLVAGNIFVKSISQINDIVVTNPLDHVPQLALLAGFVVSAIALWLSKRRGMAVGLVLLLLFVNPRVGLYGGPAIASSFSESVSQHAELYRGLAILLLALSVGLLIKHRDSAQKILLGLSAAAIVVTGINISSLSGTQLTSTAPAAGYHVYKSLPTTNIRIINAVATPNDYAWVGPIDFLDQTYLAAKRATDYTFFLPWHEDCPDCRTAFYDQLQEQRPLVIMWSGARQAANHPNPAYAADMESFLKHNYYQITSKPGFENLYFLNSQEQLIDKRLRVAGYGTD